MIQNGVIHLDYALKQDGKGDLQTMFCPQEDPQHPSTDVYYDVGWYFGNANINPLSKYKPFVSPKVYFTSKTERNNALKATRYGFGDIPMLGVNLDGTWQYHRPRGSANNEPWRLVDFDGYYNNAPCPFKLTASITKGGESYITGTGSLDIRLDFDNMIPEWDDDYCLSFRDLVDVVDSHNNRFWTEYDICFLVYNPRTGEHNLIITNESCSSVFSGYTSLFTFYQIDNGSWNPALPIIRNSNAGDTIEVMVLLIYHSPKEGNYVIYTNNTNPTWTIAMDAYSLAITPGCDRTSTVLRPLFTAEGATGTTILSVKPTDTFVSTIGTSARLFQFHINTSIDTTHCRDWRIGSALETLAVPLSVRIYVTEDAGHFWICKDGDYTDYHFIEGIDDVGQYYGYTRSVALRWNQINNDDNILYFEDAYLNNSDGDSIYIAHYGNPEDAHSTIKARVVIAQEGVDEIPLTETSEITLYYDKSYVIEDPIVNYSSGNAIKADASNYAYITGTVKTYMGSTLVDTQYNVELTPSMLSNQVFYIDGNHIYGHDLETTEKSAFSLSVKAFYDTSDEINAGSVTQEANTIVSTTGSTYVTATPDKTTNIAAAGETIPSYCYVQRSLVYTWTSGHTTAGNDHSGTVNVYLDNELLGQTSHEQWFNVVIGSNETNASASRVLKYAYSTDESAKSEITLTQNAGYITYAKPIIPDGAWYCSDIPAWGGTSTFHGSGYQTWGWNGSETGGGTDYIDITWSSPTLTAESLGTTVTSQKTLVGTSQGTIIAHGKTSDPVTGYCYQSINSKSQDGDDTLNEKVYGTPTTIHTDARNPYLTMTAQNYTDENNPCPAVGSSTLLDIVCREEQKYQQRHPWTRTKTRHYKYTSGATSTEDYAYDSGTEDRYTDWAVINMNPTITGEAEGFMRIDKVVACLDRYKTTGPLRYVDYTATFRNLSVTVRIYQQANYVSTTTRPIRTASIYEYQGERIPASGASLTVNYECYDMVSRVYTSGAVEEEHYESASDYLWGVNCSIDQSPIEVHDTGQQSVIVSSNTSSTTRMIIVGIGDSSDTRIQNGRT